MTTEAAFRDLIMIVPRLPPEIDGVGDYAFNLARGLRTHQNINTHFVVTNQGNQQLESVEEFQIHHVVRRSSIDMNQILDIAADNSTLVLLHYAARAYGYKGYPLWLFRALKSHKQRERKIAIMFHEIYGQEAALTSSDFWMAPLQKRLVKSFLQLADQCFTNCENYANCLQNLNQNKPTRLVTIPVLSTTGELDYIKPLDKRERRLIIFGQGGNKMNAYAASSAIEKSCKILGIKEVWDIGPSRGVPDSVCGIPIVRLGERAPEEVGEILGTSIAGFLSYRHDRLGKSSIFSSYCAHGVLPINAILSSESSQRSPQDSISFGSKLIPDEHYIDINRFDINMQNQILHFQKVASQANFWYREHRISVQSKLFAEYLLASTSIKKTD